jgi:hypothetical protein
VARQAARRVGAHVPRPGAPDDARMDVVLALAARQQRLVFISKPTIVFRLTIPLKGAGWEG